MTTTLRRGGFFVRAAGTALLLGLLPFTLAQAAVTPATIAGTGGTLVLAGSDSVWTGTGNITALANWAAADLNTSGDTTNYLRASNFGFSIPAGSSIDGIQVDIIRAWACAPAGGCGGVSTVGDNQVRLVKADGTVGSQNKAAFVLWPVYPGFAGQSYGGAADLWGQAWTAADINDSDFGAALAATTSNNTDRDALVASITITVTYTLGGSTTTVVCTTPVDAGSPSTCTATVQPAAGSNTPTGSVSWFASLDGVFGNESCSSPIAGTLECSATFTPADPGVPVVTATYPGDSNMAGSFGNFTIQVNAPPPPAAIPVFGPLGFLLTVLGMGLIGGWNARRKG